MDILNCWNYKTKQYESITEDGWSYDQNCYLEDDDEWDDTPYREAREREFYEEELERQREREQEAAMEAEREMLMDLQLILLAEYLERQGGYR